jgi:ribonuclease HI
MSHHVVCLFWIPGHAGIRGNDIADEFAREGSVYQFVEPQPALRTSRQNVNEKIKCWLDNQHMT